MRVFGDAHILLRLWFLVFHQAAPDVPAFQLSGKNLLLLDVEVIEEPHT